MIYFKGFGHNNDKSSLILHLSFIYEIGIFRPEPKFFIRQLLRRIPNLYFDFIVIEQIHQSRYFISSHQTPLNEYTGFATIT